MLRPTLGALVICALCAAPTTASADPLPYADGLVTERARPGTFLITEAQAGYSMGSVFAEGPDGFAAKLTLGAGGKFNGFPMRFYGIVNLTWAGYQGGVASRLSSAETERDWFAWTAGLRTLMPIAPHLRLLTDLSVGQASVDSTASLDRGRQIVRAGDSSLLLELGVGLQYRVAFHVSLGARVDLAFPLNLEGFDLVGEMAGAHSDDAGAMNPSFLATATFHL